MRNILLPTYTLILSTLSFVGCNASPQRLAEDDFRYIEAERSIKFSETSIPQSQVKKTRSNPSRSFFLGSNLTSPISNPSVIGYSINDLERQSEESDPNNLGLENLEILINRSLEIGEEPSIYEKPIDWERRLGPVFYAMHHTIDSANHSLDSFAQSFLGDGANVTTKKGNLHLEVNPQNQFSGKIDPILTYNAYLGMGRAGAYIQIEY